MTKSFKQYGMLFLGALLAFLLQSTVLKTIAIASVVPNIMLLFTVLTGYFSGEKAGMFAGFCCGLFTDLFDGSLLGLTALIYLYLGYGNGYLRRFCFQKGARLPLAFLAASDFLYGLLSYLVYFLLRGQFAFGVFLTRLILPEVVYTLLPAVPVTLFLCARQTAYAAGGGRQRRQA